MLDENEYFGSQGSQGAQDSENCSDAELDMSALADYCTLMPRRLLVSGILVHWLRMHFSDPLNIESPYLQDYVWTNDISTTGIVIDASFRFDPAETEHRPGIFIKPGPWKIIRWGIDDRKMMKTDCTDPTLDIYNNAIQGSHTIFCVSGSSGEVEHLSREVYRELMMFGPAVRRLFNFLRFVVTDVGEPAILEEATENFVVPVVISYGAQEVWKICNATSEAQLEWLKKFNIGGEL